MPGLAYGIKDILPAPVWLIVLAISKQDPRNKVVREMSILV